MSIRAYTGIVRPALTHGCLVWAAATRFKKICEKLRTFQLLALRLLGFTRKSTPSRGLEVITFTPPLELHIRMLASQSLLRNRHMSRYKETPLFSLCESKKGHIQSGEEFLHKVEFPHTNLLSDRITTVQSWEKGYAVLWDSLDPKHENYGKERKK